MDLVRHGFQQVFKQFPCSWLVNFVDQLSNRESVGAIDVDEQVELAFDSLNLDDIHVQEADRVTLEALQVG